MDYYYILFWIGRVIFGAYFLLNGVNHFLHLTEMAEFTETKKVPFPKIAVALSGILLIIGGLGILAGTFLQFTVLALVLFLLPTTIIMHNFWSIEDPKQRSMEITQFTKNLALLGAVLLLLGFIQ